MFLVHYNCIIQYGTVIDITGPFLSFDAVCVGSPVIIIIIYKKVNKQVHETIWNFQLE